MQPLSPAAEVIVQGPALEVDFGCELLNADLSLREDISADCVGGEPKWDGRQKIHRTVTLTLSRELAWGTDLVRPYMLLAAAGETEKVYVGVFCLTTPEDEFAEDVRTWTVQGFDRLYLLDRETDDSYVVADGSGYLAEVQAAFTAAGLTGVLLDGSASASTLPAAKSWPLGTTWLTVITDLLRDIGYSLWVDEQGVFRGGPDVDPAQRPAEFAFNADDEFTSLVGQDRKRTADQWRAPNRWRFVRRNMGGDPPAEPVVGDGIYVVENLTDGPSSVESRGLAWTRTVELDAADQASLVAQGDQIVAADRRVSTVLTVTTAPFPFAGHRDVYAYTDTALGTIKVVTTSWGFTLQGGDVQWTWEQT